MATSKSGCQIIDFNEYLGKRDIERHLSDADNREIAVMLPTDFSQAAAVGAKMLAGETIVLNLNYLNNEIGQRFLDFISGLCYTLNGGITFISNGVYIISVEDSVYSNIQTVTDEKDAAIRL